MVLQFSEVDPASIKISTVSKLKSGYGTYINLTDAEGKLLTVQSPVMPIPWDTKVKLDDNGKTSCAMALAFRDDTEEINQFKDWLVALKTHLVALVQPRTKEIGGKQLSMEVVDNLFRDILKLDKKELHPPTFQAKIDHSGSEEEGYNMMLTVFGPDKKLVPDVEDALRRGTMCAVIFSIPYIHVNKEMISTVRTSAAQAIVLPTLQTEVFSFNLVGPLAVAAAAAAAAAAPNADEETEAVGSKRPREAEQQDSSGGGGGDESNKKMAVQDAADDV